MNHRNSSHVRSLLETTALTVAICLVTLLFVMTLRGATQANARSAQTGYQSVLSRETETEHPQETETHHPEATETEHHDATETEHPEATETRHPEGTETEHPEATETEHPEATETHHPEGTETAHPEGTETERPQPTETEHGDATRTALPTSTTISAVVPGTGTRAFPETGKTTTGLFLQYWDKNGGLAQQGFPISSVIQERSDLNGKTYAVQYFERTAFEYHPENAAPFNVLLSQLGTFQYRQKYPSDAPNQKANQANGHYFPETNHWVGGTFWKYWQEHGGLAQQGYPISDEFTEVSPFNGKTYTVQYFERAEFEMHPENKAPFDVLLSQLGTFQFRQKHDGT